MRQPKIGLLPLYLKLYDDIRPDLRKDFGPFMAAISEGFRNHGVAVSQGEICRVKEEFGKAVERFEREQVDLIVALHLAYSPSLESADILAASKVPLLMLDTTMDAAFGGTFPLPHHVQPRHPRRSGSRLRVADQEQAFRDCGGAFWES